VVDEKLKGKANEVAGGLRRKAGAATGNEEMEAEGAAQESKGKVQGAVAAVKDKVEDIKDKVT
jgi:uncharacterized protein YjbJ (UPF0337 family)